MPAGTPTATKPPNRRAGRAADYACVVPHPAASATISNPPQAIANDFFIELTS
jgi:hypothetical protein